VILSHAEILSRRTHSRNRICWLLRTLTARGVMLGAFSNRWMSVDAIFKLRFLFERNLE